MLLNCGPCARRLPLVVAYGVALLLPTLASADFTDPQSLSPQGQQVRSPQVALRENGDAVVVWERYDGEHTRIVVRVREADGTLGSIYYLSPAGKDATDAQLDLDADGDAFIVWSTDFGEHDRIQGREFTADNDPRAIQNFSDPDRSGERPQVAVDDQGDAVIAWSLFGGGEVLVQARQRSRTGELEDTKTLSAVGEFSDQTQIASDANGDAVVVWVRYDPEPERVQARTLSRTGTLGPRVTLTGGSGVQSEPRVAMDDDGNAVVAWLLTNNSVGRVQGRTLSANGMWGALKFLSPEDANAGYLELAVNSGGVAHLVWQVITEQTFVPDEIWARAGTTGGIFGQARKISPNDESVLYPDVGVDDDGLAHIAWQIGPEDIRTRTRTAAGVLGTPETLSNGNSNSVAKIAVNEAGAVAAAWIHRLSGSTSRIQVSVGP